jgi:putative endopeptidase
MNHRLAEWRVFAAALACLVGLGLMWTSSRSGNASAEAGSNWGFDMSNLDHSCKPCEDFYKFAMGGWMAKNPIPPEYSSWGTFTELAQKNQDALRQVLETAEKAKAPEGSNEQKIGDLYASCMDTSTIDSVGLKPVSTTLAKIVAIDGTNALQGEIAELQTEGVNVLFRFGSQQDLDDSTKVIGEMHQGGLGLPDRDYYTREDDKSKQLRADYGQHVTKMFELAGDAPEKASQDARAVLNFETELAKASMTRVQMRDPHARWHKMKLPQVRELAPGWSWVAYFRELGAPAMNDINVAQPDFFKEMNRELTATPLADWKTYLRWHVLHAYAEELSDPFVQENFNFYGKKLSGAKEIQPRWRRCVQSVNRNLGEALGQVYVEKYFPPEAKVRARQMVDNLLAALREDIPTLSWMGPETKKAALAKLEAFHVKIGYPDKWRDYSKLPIERSGFLANIRRSAEFETAYDINKIGKPVDRTEWGMTPPTVNAYYRATMNEIVFPAGILQPPFYDPKADDAVNYGGMGAVIGHEITHGFDDAGSQFDANGNLRNWWNPEDRKSFQERASCVEQQFDGYEVEPGLNENGKLVLGESIADLGGLAIAYAAYERSLEGKPRPGELNGFTPEQRFFLGWAQVWGANVRPEYARLQAHTNPHPLPRFRADGPLSNMAAFAKAFGCTKGDPMVREKVCKIW